MAWYCDPFKILLPISKPTKGLKTLGIVIGFLIIMQLLRTFNKEMLPYSIFLNAHPHECICFDDQGYGHNFCYTLPQNSSVRGKKFDCRHLANIKELGLLDLTLHINLAKVPMPKPVFITAFSENHAKEGIRLITLIRTYWPTQPVIIYNLGLESSKPIFQNACNVELRLFNFSNYPSYVQNLDEYRWKPILIAESLKEFGAIWYMDSSITFKKANLNHVYDLVRCRANVTQRVPMKSIEERDYRENTTPHESGWEVQQWKDNIKECRKSAYLFHGYTGHGIFPATASGVYNFLPTNQDEIRKPKAKMYEAGLIFAVRTEDAIDMILRWYVLCALEKNCMAPPQTSNNCLFKWNDRFSTYAGCHRFDQSVANLLAANSFWYDRHYYTSEIVDFFNVVRGVSDNTTKVNFQCRQ